MNNAYINNNDLISDDLDKIIKDVAQEMGVTEDYAKRAFNMGVADAMTGFMDNAHKKSANKSKVAKNRSKRKQAKKTKRKNR